MGFALGGADFVCVGTYQRVSDPVSFNIFSPSGVPLPSANPKKSPAGMGEVAVTVALVVAVDPEAVHGVVGHCWSDPRILNWS